MYTVTTYNTPANPFTNYYESTPPIEYRVYRREHYARRFYEQQQQRQDIAIRFENPNETFVEWYVNGYFYQGSFEYPFNDNETYHCQRIQQED
jgi:hypothetical protein